jgi:hypothetical protein
VSTPPGSFTKSRASIWPSGDRSTTVERRLVLRTSASGNLDGRKLRRLGIGLVGGERIRREGDTLDQRLASSRTVEFGLGQLDTELPVATKPATDCGRRAPNRIGVDIGGIADTDQHFGALAIRVNVRVPRLPGEAGRRELAVRNA